MIQHFDHGDLRAHGGIVRRHFQADHAAADHGQLTGNLLQGQHFSVGEHEAAQVFLHARYGRDHRGGTRGDDEPLAAVAFSVRLHNEAVGFPANDLRPFHHHRDPGGAHLGAYTCNQAAHHPAPPVHHGLLINLHIAHMHAVGAGVLCVFIELCRIQQRFGGDAALVQAHAAQRVHFKQHSLQPGMCRSLRSQIAARAAANDNQIIAFHLISIPFQFLLIHTLKTEESNTALPPGLPRRAGLCYFRPSCSLTSSMISL